MLSVGAVLGKLDLDVPFIGKLEGAAAKLSQFESKVENASAKMAGSFTRAGSSADAFQQKINAVRVEQLASKLDSASTSLASFSRNALTIGVGMSAGLTAPIALAGGAILKLGMDAVETENLVSVSFGNMKGAADEWSKKLSDDLGLNQFELRKTAGTLFNMTTSMGLARDAAFDMSTGVAELAADMSSFRNIPMEEALTKIRSGLVGEAEPLKAIGILVDENTIKHEAYTKGIAKYGEELTQVQKVEARWSAILRQTANDQGDRARTMGSAANQIRSMKDRMTEAATVLGSSLMPLMEDFTSVLSKGVPYIQSAVNWFVKLPEPVKLGAVGLTALVAAAGPLLIVLGSMAGAVSTLIPIIGATGLAKSLVAAQSGVFALSNSVPILTARLWLMDTAAKAGIVSTGLLGKTVGAAFLGVGGTVAAVAVSIAGIVAGIYQIVEAIPKLWAAIKQGEAGEFFAARDKDNWLRRGLGMDTGLAGLPKTQDRWGGPRGSNINLGAEARANATQTETAIAQLSRLDQQVRNITASQAKEYEAAKRLGLNTDDLLNKWKLTETHFERRNELLKIAEDRTKKFSAAEKEFTERVSDQARKTAIERNIRMLRDQFQVQIQIARDATPPMLMALADTNNALERQGINFAANLTKMRPFKEDISKFTKELKDHNAELYEFANALAYSASQFDGWVSDGIGALSNLVAAWADASRARADYLAQGGATGSQKAGALIGGAAGVWGATGGGSMAGNLIGGAASGAIATMGIYAAFGATAGAIGIAAGALAGFTVGLVRSATALTNYEQRVRQAADDFENIRKDAIDAYGGLDRLRNLARTVGIDIDAALSLGKGPGREADPEALRDTLEELERRTNRLNSAMEKYGITLRDLGDEAKQLRVNTTGMELANEFRELTAAGVDSERAIQGMESALNRFVTQTIDAGGQIPVAMAPMIEQLIRAGRLTEENAALMLGLRDSAMPSLEDIDAAAKRYGITLDELGPKVNQLRINETAQQIVADFELLRDAGADMGAVIGKMGDSVQGLVNQAMKYGLTLPETLKPILQNMADAGLLTDDTGQKMENLSRLTFAETLTDKIEQLIEAMRTFVEGITKGAVPALESLSRTRVGKITIPYSYEQDGPSPTGFRDPDDIPHIESTPIDRGQGILPPSLTVNQYIDGRLMSRTLLPHLAEDMEIHGVTS